MSITYEWEITELLTKTEDSNTDSVVEVHWVKRGVDADGYVGEFFGTTPLTSVGSDSFTEFSSLTEATVLGWVQSAVADDEEIYNNEIQQQINTLKHPKSVKGMPWL